MSSSAMSSSATSSGTMAYIPSHIQSKLDDYKVIQIKAAAHEPISIQGTTTTKTNHWGFYLVTSPKTSIRLDMSLVSLSGIGCLIVRELDYTVSKGAVKVCDLSVEGCSLKTIIELLQREHYHCYKFNEHGTGCRNWVDSVLVLLCQNQITAENETEQARATLRKAWNYDGTLQPDVSQSGIDHGTFYGPVAGPIPTETAKPS